MLKTLGLTVCISVCCLGLLDAQDQPQEQLGEHRSAVIVRATSDDNSGQIQTIEMATSDGGDVMAFSPAAGGMPFVFGGAGNPMEASDFLLNDPGVQKELELVDAQREQLKQMKREFGDEIRSKIDGIMKNPAEDKSQIADVLKDINQRKKNRLAEILLPHQVDRLKQISLQAHVNQAGLDRALASKALMEELGIDENQQTELAKKAEQLNKEFNEKVAQLKSNLRDELLNELKPEQREKMRQLLGSKFEFEEPSKSRMKIGSPAFRTTPQSKGAEKGN